MPANVANASATREPLGRGEGIGGAAAIVQVAVAPAAFAATARIAAQSSISAS